MNKETIKARLIEIENHLNKDWKRPFDDFVERLLMRAEYDKLIKQLYGKN